jgi:hypothetical protein
MSGEKVFQVPSTATVTLEDLNGILTTAVEGGIGYWSEVKEYRWENTEIASVKVRELDREDPEKPGWHLINAMDMLRVLPLIESNSSQAKGWNIEEIVEQCDADIADIAVQLAIFGKVIYG